MENISIGYKVVKRINFGLFSYNGSSMYPKCHLRYTQNTWTYPKIPHTRLFYFDTIENAEVYTTFYGFELWKCEVINGKPFLPCNTSIPPTYYEKYHQNPNANLDITLDIAGCMAGDAIRLLEKVRG